MKPPPFLLGAALLFWGWQSGFLIVGAVMAVVLEGARLMKARWEFAEDDFSRVWTFCTLLFLAAGVYAFTDSIHNDQRRHEPVFPTQLNLSTITRDLIQGDFRVAPSNEPDVEPNTSASLEQQSGITFAFVIV